MAPNLGSRHVEFTITEAVPETLAPVTPTTTASCITAARVLDPRLPCARNIHREHKRALIINASIAYFLSFAAQAGAYTYGIYRAHPRSAFQSFAALHDPWLWLPLIALFLLLSMSAIDHVVRNSRCLARSKDVDPCLYPLAWEAKADTPQQSADHKGIRSIWWQALLSAGSGIAVLALVLVLFAATRGVYQGGFEDSFDGNGPRTNRGRGMVFGIYFSLWEHILVLGFFSQIFSTALLIICEDRMDNIATMAKHKNCCEKCRAPFEDRSRISHGTALIVFNVVAVGAYLVALIVYGYKDRDLLFCTATWKAFQIAFVAVLVYSCVLVPVLMLYLVRRRWKSQKREGEANAGLLGQGREGQEMTMVAGQEGRRFSLWQRRT